jgi:hypothetical protein
MEKKPPVEIIGGHLYGENLSFAATGDIPSFLIKSTELVMADNVIEIKNLDCSVENAINCNSGILTLRDIYQKVYANFSGKLNIDLRKLNPYLTSIFSEAALAPAVQKEPPVIFKQGAVVGKLAFSGPLQQPEKILWDGNFKGHDVSFALAGVPYKVENGRASLKLVDDNLQIDSAAFDFATLPVTLHGTFPGPGFFFQSGNSRIPDFNLKAQCVGFTPGQLNILTGADYDISGFVAGPSSLEINLSSDAETESGLKLAGRLDLDWEDVTLPFVAETIDSVRCQAEFDQLEIVFKHLTLQRNNSELSFQGRLYQDRESDEYRMTGKISSPYLALDDVSLTDESIENDNMKFSFKLDGVIDELVLPVDLSDKKDDLESLWRHFINLNFSVDGGTDVPITIDECRWNWGGERAHVNIFGELQPVDGIQGDIEIEADDLDLDTLFGAIDESETDLNEHVSLDELQNEPVKVVVLHELNEAFGDDRVKSLMLWKQKLVRDDLNLNIRARVRRLHWRQMVLDKLEGDCRFSAAGVNVERLTGRSFEGKFYIYAGWRFIDDSFMLESQLEDVSLETLSNYLKNPDRGLPMSGGEGSVTLDLYWHGDSVKSWDESLDGALDFNFHDGRLKRFTLIANIGSLLNLSQFASLHMPELSVDQGVPYQELICKGLIVGGQFEIDEFDMQGPAFNIFGSGDIDFINDQLDLKFGIQPLQTVDKILASIPVLGYIMTGDNKTFVVIPVTVTGSFDKAIIKTQTIAGMGNNTIGMVQRFFKTPIRLLQMPGKLIDKMGADNKPEAVEKNVVKD